MSMHSNRVDQSQRGQLGAGSPWQPHWGGPHRATLAPGQHGGRSNAGDQNARRRAREAVGFALRWLKSDAAGLVRTRRRRRGDLGWWQRLRWSGTSTASGEADAGLRPSRELRLEGTAGLLGRLYGVLARPRARWRARVSTTSTRTTVTSSVAEWASGGDGNGGYGTWAS